MRVHLSITLEILDSSCLAESTTNARPITSYLHCISIYAHNITHTAKPTPSYSEIESKTRTRILFDLASSFQPKPMRWHQQFSYETDISFMEHLHVMPHRASQYPSSSCITNYNGEHYHILGILHCPNCVLIFSTHAQIFGMQTLPGALQSGLLTSATPIQIGAVSNMSAYKLQPNLAANLLAATEQHRA